MGTEPQPTPDYEETVQLSAKEIAIALEKMGISGFLIVTDVSDNEKWAQFAYTNEKPARLMLDFPLVGQRAHYKDGVIRFCETHHLDYKIHGGEIIQCFLPENADNAAKVTYQFFTDLLLMPARGEVVVEINQS